MKKKNVVSEIKERIITMFNSRKEIGLHITTTHTGKMAGMYSLSTSVTENKICQARSKCKNSICSHCYSQTMMKMYKDMEPLLKKNSALLTSSVLPKEDLPLINATFFRFEAFGDLNNATQVVNYFNICRKNPYVKFALWSKNPWLIEQAINDGNKKPRNLQIVYSSPIVNKCLDLTERYDFIDKVFTVYDKQTIEKEGVEINCGARSCLKCHQCYCSGGDKFINEKKK